jgi:alpha-1,3/alpha-1,6-mannosyltransferase
MADEILVNSQFTQSIFKQAFPSIQVDPKVLYPGIHFESYSSSVNLSDARVAQLIRFGVGFLSYSFSKKRRILSINRFERKKQIELALEAFSLLRKTLDEKTFGNLQLVIAGAIFFE